MAMSEHTFTVMNSFTKSVYRDVYPAVDPKQASLSKANKIVMITGASRGIGKDGIAHAFALAGAQTIIITARKIESLKDTEELIKKVNPNIDVFPLALETTDERSVAAAFNAVKEKYGSIDILINNAGVYNSAGITLSSATSPTWWTEFAVNIHGTTLVTTHFLSLLPPDKPATVIYLSSGAGLVTLPGSSAYGITKLADLRLAAYAAAENPNITAVAVHPGIVWTDMVENVEFFQNFARDTPLLAGSVINWLASEKARFLSGRYWSANWDVVELLEREREVVDNDLLTVSLKGLTGQTAELKG